MHACTVFTRQRLAHARVMARSFLAHHPGSTLDALIVDPGPGLRADEPFTSLAPGDLFTTDEWGRMWFAYTVSELAYATKARLLRWVLDHYGEGALYLDSDIRFYWPMGQLEGVLARHPVVVIPHVLRPLPAGSRPGEQALLRSGVYNSGFLWVGREGRDFLDWWGGHLATQCLVEPDRHLNGDQRWLDLAPGLFDCHILKDPTVNVAFWNVAGRRLAWEGGRFLIDGEPLTFFHFSQYDPREPWLLSRWSVATPEASLSGNPALRRLCDGYAAELLAAGYEEAAAFPIDRDTLPDGVALDERARRVYRAAVAPTREEERLSGVPNPLIDPGGLVAWLREPAHPDHPEGPSRYLFHLYAERPGLARAFPEVPGADGARFLKWVRRRGAAALGVPEVLMPPADSGPPPGAWSRPVGPGVNVAGFLRAESGLGEAARQIAGAVQAARIPLATFTYSPARLRARQEHPFVDLQPVPGLLNPFDMNILCVNAPEVPRLAAALGPGFFSGRYTVGAWAWEFEEIPALWAAGIEAVDEIWMNSEFAAQGVRRVTAKPVRVLPLPVQAPVPSAADRLALGLPDRFTFLFVFSYASSFDRKNPCGLVQAFRRAFAPGEGPVLVVKSVGGGDHLDERERLHYEVGDRPDVILLEDYLSPGDKNALLAACDCYVSLHRSEGFGLTVAEAMALGKPTIGTGYSGNLEFMTPENSFLVGYGEGRVPRGSSQYPAGAFWAEPDLDEAAALMRRVCEDPGGARRVGERARADIARLHGPEARALLLESLLGQARAAWAERRKARRSSAAATPDSTRPAVAKGAPHGATGRRRVVRPLEPVGPPADPGGAVTSPDAGPSAVGRAEPAEPGQARRDLVWLLHRLERPPLGWFLSRRKGLRNLRDRWLGGG